MPEFAQSTLGIAVIFMLAWMVSEKRGAVRISIPLISLILQFALALILLKTPVSHYFFATISTLVNSLEEATRRGTGFVFGYLGGEILPFEASGDGSSFVLAFQALPLIIFLSALTALLNHWRVLPRLIYWLARLLNTFVPISSAAAFASVANIFVGMIESPLFIKPYLNTLARSDLFIIMTVGMSTIAGTVMIIYVGFLATVLPNAAGHLLTASVISVPAALSIAYLMVPPSREGSTVNALSNLNAQPTVEKFQSSIDALVSGAYQGLQLCLQIAAMLIVFVALVALVNISLSVILPKIDGVTLDLQTLLGYLLIPITWLIGVPWAETAVAGKLLGTKIILNEFIALRELGEIKPTELSRRSVIIMSYALSGFANIGSLGILIGGLTTMAPNRRSEIIQLAPKAIISGTFATLLTGAVIGVIY